MSKRCVQKSCSSARVTGVDWMNMDPRPLDFSIRRSITPLSSGLIPCAASQAAASAFSPIDTMQETVVSSAPDLMIEVSVLSPRRSPSAPTRMDLPAPVSPLRMFKPGENFTDSLSMMAKLWTWSSSSIRLSRPVELCPQDLVEGPPVGVHDPRLEGRAADEDAVTRLQEERLL